MAEKTRAEIEQQIANKKADIEKLRKQLASAKVRERKLADKERTHRLIMVGAEVEAVAGEIVDFESLRHYLNQFSKAINNTQEKERERIRREKQAEAEAQAAAEAADTTATAEVADESEDTGAVVEEKEPETSAAPESYF